MFIQILLKSFSIALPINTINLQNALKWNLLHHLQKHISIMGKKLEVIDSM